MRAVNRPLNEGNEPGRGGEEIAVAATNDLATQQNCLAVCKSVDWSDIVLRVNEDRDELLGKLAFVLLGIVDVIGSVLQQLCDSSVVRNRVSSCNRTQLLNFVRDSRGGGKRLGKVDLVSDHWMLVSLE